MAEPHCLVPAAPTVTRLEAFYATDPGTIAFRAYGVDTDRDVQSFVLEMFNAAGEPIPFYDDVLSIDWPWNDVSWSGDDYIARFSEFFSSAPTPRPRAEALTASVAPPKVCAPSHQEFTMRIAALSLSALLCATTIACCDKPAEAPAGPTAEQRLETFNAAPLAKVNAASPNLKFEGQRLRKDRVIAAVPVGWTLGPAMGFKPPDDAKLGFMTRYDTGSNCDGMCSPKDWAAVGADDVKQFRNTEQFKITKEVALSDPEGIMVVAESATGGRLSTKTYLTMARWKKGASRYYVCRATLDGEKAKALLPAFEQACLTNETNFLN